MSPFLVVVSAVLCVSLGSIFVRLAAAPALAVAFYRMALASLILSPAATLSLGKSLPSLAPREKLALLGAGAALATHFATWISSLSFTSVASSVLLVNMAPLFTLAFSRILLHETPGKVVLSATGLALLGAGLIAAGDASTGPEPLKGDLLALVGAVALSLYHTAGRGLRSALPLVPYLLGVWATSAVVLLVLVLVSGVPLLGYPPRTVTAFLGLALVPTLLGHGLVNRSLRLLPAPTVGLFLLGEPVLASVLAYFLFGEVPGSLTLAGGAVVIAALSLVVARA